MRKQPSPLHLLMAVLALVLSFGVARVAHADDRADARTHYQAGTRAYAASDYKTAIREFAAAQQLVPADLNSYNLALCYDKLGEAEPAVQYYREYLNKVPNTDKRGEIEASVARLDAAAKSVAAKRAEEDRRADDAKRAEDQRRADDARRLEDQRRADEARRLEESRGTQAPVGGTLPPAAGPAMGGSAPAPTGDPQLDRVQGIDINQIRGQRGGGGAAAGGLDMRTGAAPTTGAVPGPAVAQAGAPGPNGPAVPNATPGQPAAEVETPVYKKWWFWAVVGVSLYVVYEVATANSSSSQTLARPNTSLAHGRNAPAAPEGLTLLRW